MSKPARATLTGASEMRPLKVRGRPACEASRAALIKEIEKLREQVTNLQATVRLQNTMWSRAMCDGAMQGNPADYSKDADA